MLRFTPPPDLRKRSGKKNSRSRDDDEDNMTGEADDVRSETRIFHPGATSNSSRKMQSLDNN